MSQKYWTLDKNMEKMWWFWTLDYEENDHFFWFWIDKNMTKMHIFFGFELIISRWTFSDLLVLLLTFLQTKTEKNGHFCHIFANPKRKKMVIFINPKPKKIAIFSIIFSKNQDCCDTCYENSYNNVLENEFWGLAPPFGPK